MGPIPYAVLALAAAGFPGVVRTQAPPTAVPIVGVMQLGASHVPGGGAALSDGVTAVAATPAGDLVAVGWTHGALGEAHAGSTASADAFAMKLDASGGVLWIRQLGAITAPTIPALHGDPNGPGGSAAGDDRAFAVAIAADGAIYVTGSTSGSLGETNGGNSQRDIFLAKLDGDGALVWVRQIGLETAPTIVPPPGALEWGSAAGPDGGTALALDPDGDVYVGGWTTWHLAEDAGGEADTVLARFGPDGALRWVRQMGGVSGPAVGYFPIGLEQPVGLARTPSGQIVMAGYGNWISGTLVAEWSLLFSFDPDGVPTEASSFGTGTAARGMALDPATGFVFVAGDTSGSLAEPNTGRGTRDVFVAAFDAALAPLWTSQLGAASATALGLGDTSQDELVGGICLGPGGVLIVSGATGGSLAEANAGALDLFAARFARTNGAALTVEQVGASSAAAAGLDAGGSDQIGGGPVLTVHGRIALGGRTTGGLGEPQAGAGDAFVAWLDAFGSID